MIFSPNLKRLFIENTDMRDDTMEFKWPKTLGDRDRTKQYDSYVKPITAEQKIVLTQKAHTKTQKELNKAIKSLETAITHYFKAQYGAKDVIGKLDHERIELLELKEEIKKMTMNALPYKDLDLEREQEQTFMLPFERISSKTMIYLALILINIIIYASAFLFSIGWLYVVGIFFSISIFLSWFTPWSRNTEKTLANSRKVGPKIW